MRTYIASGLARPLRFTAALLTCAALSCATLSQLNLIPIEQDAALGLQAYPELLQGESVITSGQDYEMVQRVTARLVEAAKHFDPDVANQFEWEARLVNKPEMVNAWCLPGGKMAVFTGILPIAQGEAGLAVVMGHEIAHATQRHGTRAMTRQMGASALIHIASVLIFETPNAQQTAAALGEYATGFANLSFGRDAELEADATGLRYMARAGYDPREATRFWERMQALSSGASGPAWLSTHPSHGKRIEQIQGLLPEALEVYAQSGGSK
ncbi:MAG: M48 family metallopeptidase [Planctomycetota bacterium]